MAAPIILCDTAGMTNEQWLEARNISNVNMRCL